ncbi:MAG TPA: GH116 family glycosyl hydrolase [Bryobacteraceae bacterium]|nr:GH116 family glycosyl hydrolase [Bryobacteraceae bacterium]
MRISRRQLMMTAAAAPGLKAQVRSGARKAGAPAPGRTFRNEALREIAFPLGGIGTGTVSLGGFGNLRDWEIFNRPNKGSVLPFTFAALRLEGGGLAKPMVRVVERQPLAPFRGDSGVPRETGLGLPRFRQAVFTGAYPFAQLDLHDALVPVDVTLEAFNPMVPLDTENSSLPVAILIYKVTSRAPSAIDAALAFSAVNPVGHNGVAKLVGRNAEFFGKNVNEFRSGANARGILMRSDKYGRESTRYGSMALATTAPDVSYRLAWEHGEWWDDFQKWWDEYLGKGRFQGAPVPPSEDGSTEFATLAAHFQLKPGQSVSVPFVLAWHFPNTENYWSGKEHDGEALPNDYGTRWPSAWEPAIQALVNLHSLEQRSRQYRDALYSSTLPAPVIDAVSSQASILRTNTVMVLAGKRTLAFEGCNDGGGCCPMNCTHVYNYEQALAHLYPDLERSMRETDFLVNMRPDGSMSFRTPVPLQQGGNKNFPAADGQMGCVMKVYREWRLSGDDEWLRRLWPQVKRALEYAWTQWDADRDGVMEGEQHNTYDIMFYGPNSFVSSLYLGALAAAAKMARYLGENETADTYSKLFEAGAASLDRSLFNGEFYVQNTDLKRPQAAKYQYGPGCLSDQLLGQWFAEVVDLGKLLPHEHVRSTLAAIYKHNFRKGFDDFPNTQRIYAINDEAGLLLCSWPRGGRPAIPFPYSDEVWTGIEYQVAAHLIYEGMLEEGLSIVRSARDRYDGARRNPWNEVECGNHYARAMASWSLLTALSGFAYSAPERDLRFRPRVNAAAFRSMFSTGTSWGVFSQQASKLGLSAKIAVHGGKLELSTLRLAYGAPKAKVTAPQPASVAIQAGEATVHFATPVVLAPGQTLTVSLA